jgi:hypothetical protein
MNKKESPQSVIDTYKKRQQLLPTVMVILAVLLVIIGIIIIINWIGGSGGIVLFPTKTPTPTMTFTPTPTSPTPTPSMTPTITDTPVPTNTETPSGPMQYIVLEGDNCWAIAQTSRMVHARFNQIKPSSSLRQGGPPRPLHQFHPIYPQEH